MTSQPYDGPMDDDRDDDTILDPLLRPDDDDRPLDSDIDDDQVDSAEADERAAREGEIGTDRLP
jgi:hypothetical protein